MKKLLNLTIIPIFLSIACCFCVLIPKVEDQNASLNAVIGQEFSVTGNKILSKNNVQNKEHSKENEKPTMPPISISHDTLSSYDNLVGTIILGHGVSGLNAALITTRARIPTLLIGKDDGLLVQAQFIENWPGKNKMPGTQAIQELKDQVRGFGAQFLDDTVTGINFEQWPFEVTTERGITINALSVVIATGGTAFKLNVPGSKEYFGKGIKTCAICEAPSNKGQQVALVGDHDYAIDQALQLAGYAAKVYVIVPGEHMQASALMQDYLEETENIKVLNSTSVIRIEGDGNKLTNLVLKSNETEEEKTLPVQGLYVAMGYKPNSTLFKKSLVRDNKGYIKTNKRQQTSTQGVFAAGIVQDPFYQKVSSALGTGCNAGLEAVEFLQEHGFTPHIATELQEKLFIAPVIERKPLVAIKNAKELHDALEKTPQAIVNFYSPHCSVCLRMESVFEEIAQKINVPFYKVDITDYTDAVEEFGLQSTPTLIVFNETKVLNKMPTGSPAMAREFIERSIKTED